MKTITVNAPAKVNYLLDVIGQRPDGYHDLRMIMQRINLCDEIVLKLNDSNSVSVKCGAKGVPDGIDNIAGKAAKSMLNHSGGKHGVDISISKKIPVAAGLGGGSSDAASVLMGLNELLGLGFSRKKLMEIGVTLGADVPFFIFKKTALAEGIGDQLTEIYMPPAWVVLVNPGVHVSTGWVYKNLQLTNRGELAKLPNSYESVHDICSIMKNDLETVTIPVFPVISEIKNLLNSLGAAGSMMSGSGSTVFAIFESEDSAKNAASNIAASHSWFTVAVSTL